MSTKAPNPVDKYVGSRVRMRRMMLAALLIIGLAVGSTSLMRAPWQMHLLWGVVLGFGTGSMAGWLTHRRLLQTYRARLAEAELRHAARGGGDAREVRRAAAPARQSARVS